MNNCKKNPLNLQSFKLMFHPIIRYLLFALKARSRKGHGIHSPFVYDLVSRVLVNEPSEDEDKLIRWRREIELDNTIIENKNYGAKSKVCGNKKMKAGKLSRITGLPHKYGMLLYRLTREFKPASIIELGTGLGISTLYLALGNPEATIYTVEASPEKSYFAKTNMKKKGLLNVICINGNFDDHIPDITNTAAHPLLVFIDGNHNLEPTLRYFNILQKCAKENTIIIFDDIHWSTEMESAWKMITANDKVSVSIDLFRCGIVFFRKGIAKECFSVNY